MIKKWTIIFDEKHIHKTFLILALFFGTLLSLFMPLFNEPDGQYHLAVSGKIVHSIIDTSRYGEDAENWTGITAQKISYKNGTHFKKYYVNKTKFIKSSDLPRNIKYSKYNFVYFGHLVPALGLLIGKAVYPSLGVMVTFARLLTMYFSVICLFFIIKKVKFGKLVYFAIFLSPVAMNAFSSLSYDAAGFVAVAYVMMIIMNIIYEKSISRTRGWESLSALPILLLFSKWNYWILLLLLAFVLIKYSVRTKNIREKLYSLSKIKKIRLRIIAIISILILASLWVLASREGGVLLVLKRYILTFFYRYDTSMSLNDINSVFAKPYATINYMPIWIGDAWITMIVSVFLSETYIVKDKWIRFSSLVLFIVGILGVYYIQLSYKAQWSYIDGVQGRYFTPTVLLLAPFAATLKLRLNRYGRRIVPILMTLLIMVSNSLLLADTLLAAIRR